MGAWVGERERGRGDVLVKDDNHLRKHSVKCEGVREGILWAVICVGGTISIWLYSSVSLSGGF